MNIENEINEIKDEIISINSKINSLTEKIDNIISILNIDIKKNTEKMGNHIDFIEKIYDNVKYPLGYLCNKINYFSNTNKEIYLLDKSTEK